MQNDDVMLLQAPSFLMVLIAAIVKRSGGSLRSSVNDVEGITNADALGLFKDLDDPETFVLKIVKKEEYKQHLGDSSYYSNTEAKKEAGRIKEQPRYALYDDEEWEN